MLDHCRQRGGFSATGRTGNQHNAAWRFSNLLDRLKQTQLLEAGHLRFDKAHGHAELAALLEQVGAKAANLRNEVGKINFALHFQPLCQMVRHDGVHHFFHPFLGWDGTLNGDELAVDPEDDGRANFDVNVGRAAFNGGF